MSEARRSAEPTARRAAGPEKPPRRGSLAGILLIVLAVALIGGGATVAYIYWPRPAQPGQLVDLNGRVVQPEDPEATSSAFQDEANMVEDDGGAGFQVPAIKLDVPLGSINAVDDKMNPANFTAVFWVRNVGVGLDNANQGTVYMVTHAVQGGKAPGNVLQNKGKPTLKPGDLIKTNDRTYQFEDWKIVDKNELGAEWHPELWTPDPNRLIIITCLLNPAGGLAVDNMILIAKLVS